MFDWSRVALTLREDASCEALGWKYGQDDALRWLANALPGQAGVLIADEVGLGKTRIALAVIHAVAAAGGTVVVVVPPTLMHQWEGEHTKLLAARNQRLTAFQDNQNQRERRQLRTFLDAFSDIDGCYPLSKGQPFLLLSHGFGLSGRIGGTVGPYAWALPFIVRSFMEHGADNWRGAPGLKEKANNDQRLKRQLPAARWLAKYAQDLRERMNILPRLNEDVGEQFSVANAEEAGELRPLFHALLGRLLGSFDLIVIDEAHKSREKGDEESRLTRRLSFLVEEVLRVAPKHRRIGLTATPIQLSAEDWRGTLLRIGIKGEDLKRRMRAVEEFEAARQSMRSGPASDADVDKICGAAKEFRDALADIAIRRRWSAQPEMQEARKIFGEDGAHPHRRWDEPTAEVQWSALSDAQRLSLLAAEGSSLASHGSNLGIVERHRAFRLAQALETGPDDSKNDNTVLSDDTTEGANASLRCEATAKERRWQYWRDVQAAAQLGFAGRKGMSTLVTHPRLVAACDWIEHVTEGDGKVLVFASYTRPLKALADALNVRRFLREVAKNQPTKPPSVLRGGQISGNSLVEAVLQEMPDRDYLEAFGDLNQRALACGAAYDESSKELGNILRDIMPNDRHDDIIMWNVARLALIEQFLAGTSRDVLVEHGRKLVRALGIADNEEKDGETKRAGEALRDALALEQRSSQSGRSDFARTLDGKSSSPATRHILQALFNEPLMRPRVLVVQSRVGSEGLNLHAACRHVLLLHLDWNPALIEQQIGRVDRLESLWFKDFTARSACSEAPRIEIATVVLGGTSDAEKRDRIVARQRLLGAHIFGDLLAPEVMRGVKRDWRTRIRNAAVDFSPPHSG